MGSSKRLFEKAQRWHDATAAAWRLDGHVLCGVCQKVVLKGRLHRIERIFIPHYPGPKEVFYKLFYYSNGLEKARDIAIEKSDEKWVKVVK